MSKVSVIIPNYNYGRFLKESIDSALCQTLPPHEVIVVDDGSTDNSAEVLRSFGDRIMVIRQQNRGVGAARNAGAELASGEYLAFLDADDYWHAQKLEKQVDLMNSDDEIGLVHCGLVNVDVNGQPLGEYLLGEDGWVAEKLLRFQPVISGPGSASLIKKKVFMDVGGYDTNRDLHPSEDWELSYRIARKYKFGFVREPLLFYRQHGSGGHTNIRRMETAMLIAYGKAFSNQSADVQVLRRDSFGMFYSVLAGSYFRSGEYLNTIKSGIRAIGYRPQSIARILGLPIRIVQRAIGAKTG